MYNIFRINSHEAVSAFWILSKNKTKGEYCVNVYNNLQIQYRTLFRGAQDVVEEEVYNFEDIDTPDPADVCADSDDDNPDEEVVVVEFGISFVLPSNVLM